MFCSGDSAYLSDVFDKSKHGASEFPKTSLIELRSVVQSLLQRVSKLEETHITDTKNIQSLDKTVSSLKSKNASLTSELEKLRNNLDTHASGCETFRKTTNSQLKCLDGLDFTEYQVKNNKLNADVSRLSKLCSGLQKQVSEIKTTKSFAKVVSSTSTPSMLHSTHTRHNGNSHFDDHVQKPSQSDSSSAVVQNVLEKPYLRGNGNEVNLENENKNNNKSHTFHESNIKTQCKSVNGPSQVADQTHNLPDSISTGNSTRVTTHEGVLIDKQQSSADQDGLTKEVQDKLDHHKVTNNANDLPVESKEKSNKDIFLGVTYKKTSRYYICGIKNNSTHIGIKNYLESKGVHVTHLRLFKPRGRFMVRTAKVIVSPKCSQLVESPEFWPVGVICRK